MEFFSVYIREAHPTDGWRMESNDRFGIAIPQPKSGGERNQIASRCNSAIGFSMPLLVDGIDNKVEKAYSAFPDRLYLIDKEGKVAFKGGRGPFGYQPTMLEQTLVMMLMDLDKSAPPEESPPEPKPRQPSASRVAELLE